MKLSTQPSILARVLLLIGVVLFISAVMIGLEMASEQVFTVSDKGPSFVGTIWFGAALYFFKRCFDKSRMEIVWLGVLLGYAAIIAFWVVVFYRALNGI